MTKDIIIRKLSEVKPVPTSHNAGMKRVLLANEETDTNITQIAKACLMEGEVAAAHSHPDMEECFFFLSGTGIITIDGLPYEVTPDSFFRVPYGISHEVKATSKLDFFTIGIKV